MRAYFSTWRPSTVSDPKTQQKIIETTESCAQGVPLFSSVPFFCVNTHVYAHMYRDKVYSPITLTPPAATQ